MDEDKGKKEDQIKVPIKWHIPETIITRFASNMVIQGIENDFKISFFEIKPEIRLDPSAPPPPEVQADCVASIIVTADKLPNFISALQKHLDMYNERKRKKDNPSET